MTATLNALLSGAVAMATFVVALFFLRFWKKTGDRFFIYFSLSFALDGIMRVMTNLGVGGDGSAQIYLMRLVSYGLIVIAILGKNRRARKGS